MAASSYYPDSIGKIKTAHTGNERAPRGQSFIYIIQFATDDIVKVGIGEYPMGRLKALQTGAFSRLHLRFLYGPFDREDARTIEASCHTVMTENGMCGEWFGIKLDIAKFVVESQIEDFVELKNSGCVEDFDPEVSKYFFDMAMLHGVAT